MKPKKLIVFDMDGVLVDVAASYRDTVRQTARLFFAPAQGARRLPDPLFDLSELAAVKQSGGLNNDWDLTFRVVNLLFGRVPKLHPDDSSDPWRRYRKTMARCDVSQLAQFLQTIPNPLQRLHQEKRKPPDPFLAGLYKGDVGSGNIIKQIFQEIYLGQPLFESTYHLAAEVYQGPGYIQRETLLIDRPILQRLAEKNILAIATGRPQAEADYPLTRFDLKKYFTAIYSLEDCLQEEKRIFERQGTKVHLSKPHPFMLDALAKRYRAAATGFYYVGDMPDDMVAARRSRAAFKGIGLLLTAADKDSLRKELTRSGADFIIDDYEDLEEILL